jgi:hypothetical protein
MFVPLQRYIDVQKTRTQSPSPYLSASRLGCLFIPLGPVTAICVGSGTSALLKDDVHLDHYSYLVTQLILYSNK